MSIKTTSEADSLQIALKYAADSLNLNDEDTLAFKELLANHNLENDAPLLLILNEKLAEFHIKNYSFNEATPYLNDYLLIAEETNNQLQIVKALNRLAENYYQLNLVDESMKNYFRAIVISDNIEHPDSFMLTQNCVTQLGAGEVCAKMGYYDEAYEFLTEANNVAETINDQSLRAKVYLMKGFVFQEKEKYDSASYFYNKALDLSIEMNSRSAFAEAYLNLGNMNLKRKNYPEAIILLNNAYNTLAETSDLINYTKTCISLGYAHDLMNNPIDSEKYLIEALGVAEKLGMPHLLEIVHNQLHLVYEKQNKNTLAINHKNLSYRYAEQLNKDKVRTNLFNAYADHKKEKYQLYLTELQAAYKAKNKINQLYMIVSVVIAFLLLVIFIIYNRYLYMKKQKKLSLLNLVQLKTDFYSHITDELKSPVTIIMGLIEKLKSSISLGATDSNRIDLEIIEKQSENLLQLMNEILVVSKLKYKNPEDAVNGNLVSYLQYIYHCFTDLAESRNIIFLFHSNEDEIVTDYFPDTLKIVVDNLLNMCFFQCENQQVMMLIRRDLNEKRCIIEIHDDCDKSIDDKLIQMVNDNQWVDRTAESAHVFHKDLFLVKQLIINMKGEFFINRSSQSGTTFTIVLPLLNKSKLKGKLPRFITDKKSHPEDHLVDIFEVKTKNVTGKPLILIVEDNKYMQFYISSILRDRYNIAFASNGKEGLDIATEMVPDLIITDYILPLVNGIKMSETLKKSAKTGHIPIIMLTVESTDEDRIHAIRVGIDVFLNKPFIEEELKVNIEQLLSKRADLKRKFNQVVIGKSDENKKQADQEEMIFMQKVTDFIHAQMGSDKLSPQLIASEMSISSTQLNRRIKAISGLNTTSYILVVKLNKAKKMLVSTQKPIGEIAMDCGFSDFAYFSRTFKKEFGMTPSQFQRIHIEK